jgi:hypothetical protein
MVLMVYVRVSFLTRISHLGEPLPISKTGLGLGIPLARTWRLIFLNPGNPEITLGKFA